MTATWMKMPMKPHRLGLVTVLASAAACAAAAPPGATPAALDCMIQPSQIVQVGSASAGVISRILVDRGDLVERGQEIVKLKSKVERAALALARERAAQGGELRMAKGAHVLAQRELARADELVAENFVSKTYLDKARAEAETAGGRTDQARERARQASREVDLAEAQLSQRTIRAPIAGVVVERYLSPGEFVEQKPVLRLAAIDPLRVDVLVPAPAFGQIQAGMTGSVLPELLNRVPRKATVTTVDRVIDAASNTFRVRLELPNPGGALPAGLRCKIEFAGLQLGDGAARRAPAGPVADVAVAPVITPAAARVTTTATAAR